MAGRIRPMDTQKYYEFNSNNHVSTLLTWQNPYKSSMLNHISIETVFHYEPYNECIIRYLTVSVMIPVTSTLLRTVVIAAIRATL